MKEIATRQMYMRQLKRNLRFKYSKEDIESILSDYNEIFDVEITQGKSENEVCQTLGNPRIIAQNISMEIHPKERLSKIIFSKDNVLQGILIIIMCLVIANVIHSLDYRYGSYILIQLSISYPLVALLLWLVLIRNSHAVSVTSTDKRMMCTLVPHVICFLVFSSLFLFLNNVVMNLKNEMAGYYVVLFLYTLVVLLLGLIIYSFYQYKKNIIAFYGVICHALGVLAIILYYVNVLHTLTTVSLFSMQIIKSGLLYLETLIVIFIFYICTCKRKTQKWMHN